MGRKDKKQNYDLEKMRDEELRIDAQRTNSNINTNPYNQYPNYGYIPANENPTQISSQYTQSELHVPRHSKEHFNKPSNKSTKKLVDPEIKKEKRIKTWKTIYRVLLILIILALLTFVVLGILKLVK